MAQLEQNNSKWSLNTNNYSTIILQTKDTYLDKDIEIQTNITPSIYTASTIPSSSGKTIQFTGLPGKPEIWQINCPLNGQLMWLGAYLVCNLAYNGSQYSGFSIYQPSSNDYVTLREPEYTTNYSNGTLTITMTNEDLIMGDMTYTLMAYCS